MDLKGWDERYRTTEAYSDPTPLLMETAARLAPAKALDLACGAGRNALWLASHGWKVTAVDGAPAAIETLRGRAREQGLGIDARVADLEHAGYRIEPDAWDLVAMCYYLQRDLLDPAKAGVAPGGVLLAIVHIAEPGEGPTRTRMQAGELRRYFTGWEIQHDYEGKPSDASHQRWVAEIVARRPSL